MIPLNLEVVACLQVDPESITRAEESSEAQCGVRADPTLAVDDFVDPTRRNGDRDSQAMLRDPERLQEVQQQDLAWVDRRHGDRHLSSSQW